MKNHPLVLLHLFILHTMDLLYQKYVASDNFSTKHACWIIQVTKDIKYLQRKWSMEKLLISGYAALININYMIDMTQTVRKFVSDR